MNIVNIERAGILARRLEILSAAEEGFGVLHPERETVFIINCNQEEFKLVANKEELLGMVGSMKARFSKEIKGLGIDL